MPRPGTRIAEQLLKEIAQQHEVKPEMVKGKSRKKKIVSARREFCCRAKSELKLGVFFLAHFLDMHDTSILYHYNAEFRERKNARRLRRTQ